MHDSIGEIRFCFQIDYSSKASDALDQLNECLRETCCVDVADASPQTCQRTNNVARDVKPFNRKA